MPYFALLLVFILSACGSVPTDQTPLILNPAQFDDLPGWEDEDFKDLAIAFERSCNRIGKTPSDRAFAAFPQGGTYKDWQEACAEFSNVNHKSPQAMRYFFETNFQPWIATAAGHKDGLFTGYYEASLKGSRQKTGPYKYPLHSRPSDLVMVNLGEFRESLKGERIAGRVVDGQLKLYEDRADITKGRWPHNDHTLVWVDDPVDAFFVQIQGSGVVQLDDGSVMRIGYAGQNGHPYYAIGRELIRRGYLEKDEVSMQSIREWLNANPQEAEEIMNTNPSYVFFKEQDQGATGGEGVVLTAGRSLAVDRSKIPYGLPVWLDVEEPSKGAGAIRRMLIAQDTGGAIRGAVRGDVYWGYGSYAEQMAGVMKSEGRYWFLLPKTAVN